MPLSHSHSPALSLSAPTPRASFCRINLLAAQSDGIRCERCCFFTLHVERHVPQQLSPCCWMLWSEGDWLSLLVFLALLLVAAMSWPNNRNPSNHNTPQQQPPQSQHSSPANASAVSSLTRATATTGPRPAHASSSQSAPSMDLSLPAAPPTIPFSSTADEHAYIAALLQHAHSSLAQQKPMQALGLVLAAVRQQRGEEGVFDVLNETREGYGLKPHANPARQQREMMQQQQQQRLQQMGDDEDMGMAALSLQSADPALLHQLAQRLQPPSSDGGYEDTAMADESEGEYEDEDEDDEAVEGDASILEETGNGDLLDEAVRGGTHVTCRACGGVIARTRMEAHAKFWCEANDHSGRHGEG